MSRSLSYSEQMSVTITVFPRKPSNATSRPPDEEGPPNYIIEFKHHLSDSDIDTKIKNMETKYKFKSKHVFKGPIKGFAGPIPKDKLQELLDDEDIVSIEKDSIMTIMLQSQQPIQYSILQFGALWDQTMTNTVTTLSDDFSSVHCYVVDTGILQNHVEFAPGQVSLDYNAINGTKNASDDNGHGTAVASIVGGINVGIALKTKLHAIKVLDKNGSGYTSTIISGLNWILSNRNQNFPTIINMSLGGSQSTALNNAVQTCIANGNIVVVAAGNSGLDSCSFSPANALTAINAAAIDMNKTRPSWSNYGKCVDVFAPGVSVKAAYGTTSTSYSSVNGTSFSAPTVAGVVARYLKNVPTAKMTDVNTYILASNINGDVINAGTESPNRRVYWDPTKIGKVC